MLIPELCLLFRAEKCRHEDGITEDHEDVISVVIAAASLSNPSGIIGTLQEVGRGKTLSDALLAMLSDEKNREWKKFVEAIPDIYGLCVCIDLLHQVEISSFADRIELRLLGRYKTRLPRFQWIAEYDKSIGILTKGKSAKKVVNRTVQEIIEAGGILPIISP